MKVETLVEGFPTEFLCLFLLLPHTYLVFHDRKMITSDYSRHGVGSHHYHRGSGWDVPGRADVPTFLSRSLKLESLVNDQQDFLTPLCLIQS